MHYLLTADAAAHLGVTPRTVVRWCDAGILPAARNALGHREIPQPAVHLLQLAHDYTMPVARYAADQGITVDRAYRDCELHTIAYTDVYGPRRIYPRD